MKKRGLVKRGLAALLSITLLAQQCPSGLLGDGVLVTHAYASTPCEDDAHTWVQSESGIDLYWENVELTPAEDYALVQDDKEPTRWIPLYNNKTHINKFEVTVPSDTLYSFSVHAPDSYARFYLDGIGLFFNYDSDRNNIDGTYSLLLKEGTHTLYADLKQSENVDTDPIYVELPKVATVSGCVCSTCGEKHICKQGDCSGVTEVSSATCADAGVLRGTCSACGNAALFKTSPVPHTVTGSEKKVTITPYDDDDYTTYFCSDDCIRLDGSSYCEATVEAVAQAKLSFSISEFYGSREINILIDGEKQSSLTEAGEAIVTLSQGTHTLRVEDVPTAEDTDNYSMYMSISDVTQYLYTCDVCAQQVPHNCNNKTIVAYPRTALSDVNPAHDKICFSCGTTEHCNEYTDTHDYGNAAKSFSGRDTGRFYRIENKIRDCGDYITVFDRCLRCEDIVRSSTTRTEHTYPIDVDGQTLYTMIKEQTCTQDGEGYVICKNCSTRTDETFPAPGHDLKREERHATCTQDGVTGYFCSICGELDKSSYYYIGEKAQGHAFSYKDITATCTQDGTATKYCSRCGQEFSGVFYKALGHDYNTDDRYSCGETTAIRYTCSRCGDTYTDSVDVAEHDFVETSREESTCIKKGKVAYTCSVCGEGKEEELPLAAHHYVCTTQDSPADPLVLVSTYTCDTCGDTYTKERRKNPSEFRVEFSKISNRGDVLSVSAPQRGTTLSALPKQATTAPIYDKYVQYFPSEDKYGSRLAYARNPLFLFNGPGLRYLNYGDTRFVYTPASEENSLTDSFNLHTEMTIDQESGDVIPVQQVITADICVNGRCGYAAHVPFASLEAGDTWFGRSTCTLSQPHVKWTAVDTNSAYYNSVQKVPCLMTKQVVSSGRKVFAFLGEDGRIYDLNSDYHYHTDNTVQNLRYHSKLFGLMETEKSSSRDTYVDICNLDGALCLALDVNGRISAFVEDESTLELLIENSKKDFDYRLRRGEDGVSYPAKVTDETGKVFNRIYTGASTGVTYGVSNGETYKISIEEKKSILSSLGLNYSKKAYRLVTELVDAVSDADEGYYSKVVTASDHKLALDSDGNVWAAGSNESYQLGTGTTADSDVYVQVTDSITFVDIAASEGRSAAVDIDGNLYVWGKNEGMFFLDETTYPYIETPTLALNADVCGHEYSKSSYSVVEQPTCAKGGLIRRECALCGDVEQIEVGPSTHSFLETKVDFGSVCKATLIKSATATMTPASGEPREYTITCSQDDMEGFYLAQTKSRDFTVAIAIQPNYKTDAPDRCVQSTYSSWSSSASLVSASYGDKFKAAYGDDIGEDMSAYYKNAAYYYAYFPTNSGAMTTISDVNVVYSGSGDLGLDESSWSHDDALVKTFKAIYDSNRPAFDTEKQTSCEGTRTIAKRCIHCGELVADTAQNEHVISALGQNGIKEGYTVWNCAICGETVKEEPRKYTFGIYYSDPRSGGITSGGITKVATPQQNFELAYNDSYTLPVTDENVGEGIIKVVNYDDEITATTTLESYDIYSCSSYSDGSSGNFWSNPIDTKLGTYQPGDTITVSDIVAQAKGSIIRIYPNYKTTLELPKTIHLGDEATTVKSYRFVDKDSYTDKNNINYTTYDMSSDTSESVSPQNVIIGKGQTGYVIPFFASVEDDLYLKMLNSVEGKNYLLKGASYANTYDLKQWFFKDARDIQQNKYHNTYLKGGEVALKDISLGSTYYDDWYVFLNIYTDRQKTNSEFKRIPIKKCKEIRVDGTTRYVSGDNIFLAPELLDEDLSQYDIVGVTFDGSLSRITIDAVPKKNFVIHLQDTLHSTVTTVTSLDDIPTCVYSEDGSKYLLSWCLDEKGEYDFFAQADKADGEYTLYSRWVNAPSGANDSAVSIKYAHVDELAAGFEFNSGDCVLIGTSDISNNPLATLLGNSTTRIEPELETDNSDLQKLFKNCNQRTAEFNNVSGKYAGKLIASVGGDNNTITAIRSGGQELTNIFGHKVFDSGDAYLFEKDGQWVPCTLALDDTTGTLRVLSGGKLYDADIVAKKTLSVSDIDITNAVKDASGYCGLMALSKGQIERTYIHDGSLRLTDGTVVDESYVLFDDSEVFNVVPELADFAVDMTTRAWSRDVAIDLMLYMDGEPAFYKKSDYCYTQIDLSKEDAKSLVKQYSILFNNNVLSVGVGVIDAYILGVYAKNARSSFGLEELSSAASMVLLRLPNEHTLKKNHLYVERYELLSNDTNIFGSAKLVFRPDVITLDTTAPVAHEYLSHNLTAESLKEPSESEWQMKYEADDETTPYIANFWSNKNFILPKIHSGTEQIVSFDVKRQQTDVQEALHGGDDIKVYVESLDTGKVEDITSSSALTFADDEETVGGFLNGETIVDAYSEGGEFFIVTEEGGLWYINEGATTTILNKSLGQHNAYLNQLHYYSDTTEFVSICKLYPHIRFKQVATCMSNRLCLLDTDGNFYSASNAGNITQTYGAGLNKVPSAAKFKEILPLDSWYTTTCGVRNMLLDEDGNIWVYAALKDGQPYLTELRRYFGLPDGEGFTTDINGAPTDDISSRENEPPKLYQWSAGHKFVTVVGAPSVIYALDEDGELWANGQIPSFGAYDNTVYKAYVDKYGDAYTHGFVKWTDILTQYKGMKFKDIRFNHNSSNIIALTEDKAFIANSGAGIVYIDDGVDCINTYDDFQGALYSKDGKLYYAEKYSYSQNYRITSYDNDIPIYNVKDVYNNNHGRICRDEEGYWYSLVYPYLYNSGNYEDNRHYTIREVLFGDMCENRNHAPVDEDHLGILAEYQDALRPSKLALPDSRDKTVQCIDPRLLKSGLTHFELDLTALSDVDGITLKDGDRIVIDSISGSTVCAISDAKVSTVGIVDTTLTDENTAELTTKSRTPVTVNTLTIPRVTQDMNGAVLYCRSIYTGDEHDYYSEEVTLDVTKLKSLRATYTGPAIPVGTYADTDDVDLELLYENGDTVSITYSQLTDAPDTLPIEHLGDNDFPVEFEVESAEFTVEGYNGAIGLTAVYKGAPVEVVGDYNKSDVEVTASFSDGSVRVLSDDEWTESSLTVTDKGVNTFTATYDGQSALYSVAGITDGSIKAEYKGTPVIVGHDYKKNDVEVTLTDKDRDGNILSQRVLSDNEWAESSLTVTKDGDNDFIATYTDEYIKGGECSDVYTVRGVDDSRIIDTLTAVYTGAPIEVVGVYDKGDVDVVATYTDGTSELVNKNAWTANSLTVTDKGLNQFRASYNGKVAEYSVPGLVKATLTAEYTGMPIAVGYNYKKDDVVVMLHEERKDGSAASEDRILSEDEWEENSLIVENVGANGYTATYTDPYIIGGLQSADYEVTGYEMPPKAVIKLEGTYDGDELVGTPFEERKTHIVVTFEDGSTQILDYSKLDEKPSDKTVAKEGDNHYQIGYQSVRGILTVRGFDIEGITAEYKGPDIVVGRNYAKSDVVVTGHYKANESGKTTFVVKDFDVSDLVVHKTGANSYVATYGKHSADYTVNGINPIVSVKTEYTGKPVKVGKNYNEKKVVTVVTYADKTTAKVPYSKLKDRPKSQKVKKVGRNKYTATYKGFPLSWIVVGVDDSVKKPAGDTPKPVYKQAVEVVTGYVFGGGPKTGDDSHLPLAVACTLSAMALLTYLIVSNKRKKRTDTDK